MNDPELTKPEEVKEAVDGELAAEEEDDLLEEDALLDEIRQELGIEVDQTEEAAEGEDSKQDAVPDVVKVEKRESPEEIRKRKKYEFTEVSDGKKAESRRFSKSKHYLGIKDVALATPIVRGGNFGPYIPKSSGLDAILTSLKARNQKWTEELSQNQRAIFKKYLKIELLTEEILKKSEESQLHILARVSEEKMDEFNVVDVSILKYKAHLTYLTQRLENMEQLCDKTFDELKKKYETKLLANKSQAGHSHSDEKPTTPSGTPTKASQASANSPIQQSGATSTAAVGETAEVQPTATAVSEKPES